MRNTLIRDTRSFALVGLVAAAATATPAGAQEQGAAPVLPPASVLKAVFSTTAGTISNVGTGFLLEVPGRGAVFVTALHVFGPPGGLAEWVASADLPEMVESATLTDAFTGASAGDVVAVVPTPTATLPTQDGGEAGRDFAVFEIGDRGRAGLAPASAGADELWIVSPGLPDDVPLPVRRVEGAPQFLSVAIPDELSLPLGISGSPIVTSDGAVAGLVVMLGRGPRGERVIQATPVATVLEALAG